MRCTPTPAFLRPIESRAFTMINAPPMVDRAEATFHLPRVSAEEMPLFMRMRASRQSCQYAAFAVANTSALEKEDRKMPRFDVFMGMALSPISTREAVRAHIAHGRDTGARLYARRYAPRRHVRHAHNAA